MSCRVTMSPAAHRRSAAPRIRRIFFSAEKIPGSALAATYYTEPVTTYGADIIFIASDKTLTTAIPAIYSHLQSKGWPVEHKHLLIKDFPVQFLTASGLTEEAVRDAKSIEYEGVPAKVFSPNTSSPSRRALAGTKILRALSKCLIR